MDTRDIYHRTTRHFLAPVLNLLDDESVTEVLINGPQAIYFERRGKLQLAEGVCFAGESALLAAARNIAEFAGRPLASKGPAQQHSLDARLPDGSRVHVILPPCSRNGVCISIRKFSPSTLTLPHLIGLQTLNAVAAEFLSLAVAAHRNIIVAGGTGSGKTSLLNALSSEIAAEERIVVIEDSSELQLQQPHTIYLEAQPAAPDGTADVSIRDLFVDSLRMRPDRILVGEVRRGEALDLIQSMISGHSGSMATVHATTPQDATTRLETLCLMSGVEIPVYVARTQVASAIHLIVQINRFPDGSRRIQSITESRGLASDGSYQLVDIFRLQAERRPDQSLVSELVWTGTTPCFAESISVLGLADRIDHSREIFFEKSL